MARLLSTLRRQLKETSHNDVQCLLDLECDAKHPLEKLLQSQWSVTGEIVKRTMRISLTLPKPPIYEKKYLNEFQVSMQVIFPDFDRVKLKKETEYNEVLHKTNYPSPLEFEIPVPAKSTMAAVFLKVTGCKAGVALNNPQTTGMRCVAVGIIPGKENSSAKKKAAAKRKQAITKKSKAAKKSANTAKKKK